MAEEHVHAFFSPSNVTQYCFNLWCIVQDTAENLIVGICITRDGKGDFPPLFGVHADLDRTPKRKE